MRISKHGECAPRHRKPIQDWMDRTGRKQADLAALLGVTPVYVSLILGGHRPVSLLLAMNLELVTGIPAERMCTDRNAVRILKLYGERQSHAA